MMDAVKDLASSGLTATKRALSSAPPNNAYLRWDAPGVETPVENEEEKMKKIGETMNRMQEHNFDRHRRAFTATHVKTQGIVKGTLTVPELPAHLQQGLFATPGTYPVAARYANEPVFLQADQEPGPRGMALRVFDVVGERLRDVPGNEKLSTQDFFWNNAPMIELTDIDTCLDIVGLFAAFPSLPRLFWSCQTCCRRHSLKRHVLRLNAFLSLAMLTANSRTDATERETLR